MSRSSEPSGTSTPSSGAFLGVGVDAGPRTRSTGRRSFSSPARSAAHLSASHSDAPTGWPCDAKNGRHCAADEHRVGDDEEARQDPNCRSPWRRRPTATKAGCCGSARPAPTLHRAEQPSGRLALDVVGDALGRDVRAVRGAERVIDVDRAHSAASSRDSVSSSRSPGSKRRLSSSSDVAVAQLARGRLDVVAVDDPLGERHPRRSATGCSEKLGSGAPSGRSRTPAAPGAHRGRAARRASVRRAHARVVGHVPRPVERHVIEVDADEDALAFDVAQIVQRSTTPA